MNRQDIIGGIGVFALVAIFVYAFCPKCRVNAQTNVTTVSQVTLTTVVSNDYVSIGTAKLHNGSNYNLLLPVTVTNSYITGSDIRVSHSEGKPSTNLCELRFEPILGPGPQWGAPPPLPILPSK